MTDEKIIEKLIERELVEANEKFPLFQSPHEAYGVLKEEVEELTEEVETMNKRLADLWREVREDEPTNGTAGIIYRYAVAAAQEAIQCAAMCKKIEQSRLY
jgi:predicted nuclease with TOPRIM domain